VAAVIVIGARMLKPSRSAANSVPSGVSVEQDKTSAAFWQAGIIPASR